MSLESASSVALGVEEVEEFFFSSLSSTAWFGLGLDLLLAVLFSVEAVEDVSSVASDVDSDPRGDLEESCFLIFSSVDPLMTSFSSSLYNSSSSLARSESKSEGLGLGAEPRERPSGCE